MSIPYESLRAHFAELTAHSPDLTSRFFTVLFVRHPQTTEMFLNKEASTMASALYEALEDYVAHMDDPAWLSHRFAPLGSKHQQHGVTREMYRWFGEALLITLRHASGPAWTDELSRGWLRAYDALCAFLHMGYKEDVTLELHLLNHEDADYSSVSELLVRPEMGV